MIERQPDSIAKEFGGFADEFGAFGNAEGEYNEEAELD